MTFYRLRFINTMLFFVIGIMIGVYISDKKGFAKKVFSFSSDYSPVYYNRKNITDDYRPKYYKDNNKVEDAKMSVRVRDENFINDVKQQNPILDEDEDFVIVDTNSEASADKKETVTIDEFLKNSSNYKGVPVSGKLILLKGEIKKYPILYFLYSSNYYITVRDEKGVITNKDDYKIGYFYDVTFITDGDLSSNILLSIIPTGEKTNWSLGVNAF
jgi:hypothetical protein